MRALNDLYQSLSKSMQFMHQARWRALWTAVEAVLRGRKLWLAALGRARCTARGALPKHSIKAIDRLLGNVQLYSERKQIYAVIIATLLGRLSRPVILVDEVQFQDRTATSALVACLAFEGRALPIYAIVGKRKRVENQRVLRRFLHELAEILSPACRPIFITDAAYERPWFKAVEQMGWDYIGRVRNRTQFYFDGNWVRCAELHRLTTTRPKDFGYLPFPKKDPLERRIILSKKPRTKGRNRYTHRGTIRMGTGEEAARRRAREPWVLVTSLRASAKRIVSLYALRMQIEDTFRDNKSHRWGWSLRHTLSRSSKRLEVLLLIGALAYIAQVLVGIAAEHSHLHHRYQANTIRTRRVLSLFLLGSYVLASNDPALDARALRIAVVRFRKKVTALVSPCDR